MPTMVDLQEIGILKSISYDKNIVQFYGASMVGREPMLLLEFCEGGDLRSVGPQLCPTPALLALHVSRPSDTLPQPATPVLPHVSAQLVA
jgi:serine/threonine protein kinase